MSDITVSAIRPVHRASIQSNNESEVAYQNYEILRKVFLETLVEEGIRSCVYKSDYQKVFECDPSDASAEALIIPFNRSGLILTPDRKIREIKDSVRVRYSAFLDHLPMSLQWTKEAGYWDEFKFDPDSQFIEIVGDKLGIWWQEEKTQVAKEIAPLAIADAVKMFNIALLKEVCTRADKDPAIYIGNPHVSKHRDPRSEMVSDRLACRQEDINCMLTFLTSLK